MSLWWKTAVRAEGFVSQKDENEASEYALFKFALAGHRVQESRLRFPDVPVFEPRCTTNQWHLVHLGSRADGGAALVLGEVTAVLQKGESRREILASGPTPMCALFNPSRLSSSHRARGVGPT